MNTRQKAAFDTGIVVLLAAAVRFLLLSRNPVLYGLDAYAYSLGLFSQYPLFTGLIKGLILAGLSITMIQIVQIVLAASASAVYYRFVLGLFRKRSIALFAAVVMTFYPAFLVYSIVPYTEPLFLFLMLSGLTWLETARKGGPAGFPTREPGMPEAGQTQTDAGGSGGSRTVSSRAEAARSRGRSPENPRTLFRRYAGPVIFLGLACLTRYEAFPLIPIAYAVIAGNEKRLKNPMSTGCHVLLLLSLSWGAIGLFAYKAFFFKGLCGYQADCLFRFANDMVPFLIGLVRHGIPALMVKISEHGMGLVSFVSGIGFVIAVSGFVNAYRQDPGRHLPYGVYIIMVSVMQLFPIYFGYMLSPDTAAVEALNFPALRTTLIPAVFVIAYLSRGVDCLLSRFRQDWLKRSFPPAAALILTAVFLAAGTSIIGYYQRVFYTSTIEPFWVGQPADQGKTMIVLVDNQDLRLRLQGAGLAILETQVFGMTEVSAIEAYIVENDVQYVIVDLHYQASFERFRNRTGRFRFRELAGIKGMIHVYVREGPADPADPGDAS